MSWVADVLDRLSVTGRDPTSFPDGAAFRIEIPSVEGPKVLEAVLRAAVAEGITVNRISQGSGAVLMRAVELRDMAQAGLEAGVEVCLFVGPRERFAWCVDPACELYDERYAKWRAAGMRLDSLPPWPDNREPEMPPCL